MDFINVVLPRHAIQGDCLSTDNILCWQYNGGMTEVTKRNTPTHTV